ncbi:hypothetical protein BKG82_26135 [Mycobacteroides chelonae]|uniref:Uncharacterized protein n=1 Tax=Mycobacteroides chelonae TaxID=1774 RepID=A0A1S1LFP6_MYCCH|nr:hypothetical protein [Mycobacteroides chelonae]OHU47140.1 hypothetical protein BKG82_26135 [Mycobacteroides chelonae]
MSKSTYATDTVSTWIVSEGEELPAFGARKRVAEHAADLVRAGNIAGLRDLVEQAAFKTSGEGRWAAAGEVRDVLKAEGLDSVSWGDVAAAVRQSSDIN